MLESLSIARFLLALHFTMATSSLNALIMEEKFNFHANEMCGAG
jgi:hypothetical protein